MHVVGQFRYGTAEKSAPLNFSSANGVGTSVSATGTQKLHEDHWLVDFGIGRDFGLGAGHAMWTPAFASLIFAPNLQLAAILPL
jgi:hypothetical protein